MNPTTELKKIINSFENTSSNIDIHTFDSVISRIGPLYKNTPSVITLLKMTQLLTRYLASKQKAAHVDALPLLKTIIGQLVKIVDTPHLDQKKIDSVVSEQMDRYKIFQNKIISNPNINIKDMDGLKAVILAIDWEISDVTLNNFETVVTQLLSKLKGYKIHHTFLKMIHSIGRFIGIQKVNAPTDSISFLRSVFENLQHIVQTKEMTFNEKKQLLEKDISRFQDFKQRISKPKKTAKAQQDTQTAQAGEIIPALSHVKTSPRDTPQDLTPLTELSEEDLTSDHISPALVDKHDSTNTPRDVMDDLFSMKESPADELLDAIHLMEVQGQGGENNVAQMFDQDDESQTSGLKKFTPQRKDNTPIAEIDSRLNEFFNLETPDDLLSEPVEAEIIKKENGDTESVESIVPFEDEDESFSEPTLIDNDKKLSDDPSGYETLKRLESSIKEKAWLKDKTVLNLIGQDITFLKTAWKDDIQKISLLEIISFNLDLSMGTLPENQAQDPNFLNQNSHNMNINNLPKGSSGILGKIKSMFTS